MRDEIYCGGLISEDYLEHYGRAHDENPPGRGSGRFPYGSGKQPHQNHDDDPKPKKKVTVSKLTSSNKSKDKKESSNTAVQKPTGDMDAFKKAYANEDYTHEKSKKLKEIKEIAADPAVKKARDEMLEADSEYQKYANSDDWEYYARMAANVNFELLDPEYKDPGWGGIEGFEDFYVYDDGDQGDYNSFTCYLIDHKIDPNKYEKQLYDSRKKYEDEITKVARRVYGDRLDEKLNDRALVTLEKMIPDVVESLHDDEAESAGNENPFGGYYMDPGISKHGMNDYQKALNVMEEYKKTHPRSSEKDEASHSDVSDEELSHSTGPWKKHKYIRKDGDRYIYPGTGRGRSGAKSEHAKKVEAAYNDPLFNEYVSTHSNTSAIGADDFYEWKAKREKKNPALETAKKVLKPVTDFYKERQETGRKLMTEGVKKAGELAGSLFFKKNDKTERSMDRHLAKRPLSRKKRVDESNSVGVRRRKKYGSTLTGRR